MPAPCSSDLRWQIIWLVLEMRLSSQEGAALLLGVTQRTIFSILCRFRRIGGPNVIVILLQKAKCLS